MVIKIQAKIDTKSQRRVQCFIPHFMNTCKDFITYRSSVDGNSVNEVRGGEQLVPLFVVFHE